MLRVMRSVTEILDTVYGGKAEASAALSRNKSSPWNWERAGVFPAPVAIQISLDAKDRGIDLPLDEIPTLARASA